MIQAKESQRGTTLAELLVAVVFVAVCASGIVACVAGSQKNASYARRRGLALATISGEIDKARAEAKAGTLATGTGAPVAVAGIPGSAQIVRQVALASGYTDLYTVTATITWQEPTASGSRAESMKLVTLVRSPDG